MKSEVRIDRIRELREARGWSQRELSLRCGFGEAQINKYEIGANDPSATVLKIIAIHLDVSADYLLGLTDLPRGTLGETLTAEEHYLISAYHRGDNAAVLDMVSKRLRQANGNQ